MQKKKKVLHIKYTPHLYSLWSACVHTFSAIYPLQYIAKSHGSPWRKSNILDHVVKRVQCFLSLAGYRAETTRRPTHQLRCQGNTFYTPTSVCTFMCVLVYQVWSACISPSLSEWLCDSISHFHTSVCIWSLSTLPIGPAVSMVGKMSGPSPPLCPQGPFPGPFPSFCCLFPVLLCA